jgi:hypothetical protein
MKVNSWLGWRNFTVNNKTKRGFFYFWSKADGRTGGLGDSNRQQSGDLEAQARHGMERGGKGNLVDILNSGREMRRQPKFAGEGGSQRTTAQLCSMTSVVLWCKLSGDCWGGTRKIRNTTLTQVKVLNTFNSTVKAQRDWNSSCK